MSVLEIYEKHIKPLSHAEREQLKRLLDENPIEAKGKVKAMDFYGISKSGDCEESIRLLHEGREDRDESSRRS